MKIHKTLIVNVSNGMISQEKKFQCRFYPLFIQSRKNAWKSEELETSDKNIWRNTSGVTQILDCISMNCLLPHFQLKHEPSGQNTESEFGFSACLYMCISITHIWFIRYSCSNLHVFYIVVFFVIFASSFLLKFTWWYLIGDWILGNVSILG